MSFLSFLRNVFRFTPDVKPKPVSDAEEITQAVANGIAESVKTANEKQPSLEARLTGRGGLMTVNEAKRILVDWCKSQVGYQESWDGSNKYADGVWDVKLYGFSAMAVPWCDVFADAAFISCFGFDKGTEMTYQKPSGFAACSLSADAYKEHGAFYYEPEVGDQIFFIYGGGINHTGIVIEVNGDSITCVEGNYSDGVGRTYYKWSIANNIAGYGRPDWSVVSDEELVPNQNNFDDIDDTPFDIVHPEHRTTFLHLAYGDGFNNPLPQVKAWQNLLLCWGYNLGLSGADGEYGLNTRNATLQWQQDMEDIGVDIEVNGIVDEDDWKAIIFIPGVGD